VKYPYPLYLAIPCLLAAPTPASGQLPEILVTAEFRDTALLESSNSVSVLGADAIRRRSAQHLEELLNMAPNVNFASGSSRARYFQIRGIGDRGQFREPLNPSVGVLIDGVDFSGIGTASTLFDVAQVEVLRGPQGTLHGANALAGLINVRSNEPGEEFHHRIEAGVGNYGAFSLGAVSGGPLSERLLYRVAVRRYTGDGFQENEFLGADDTNDRDELTLRGRLRWLVGAGHTVDMTLIAKAQAGNTAESPVVTFRLPARAFTQPPPAVLPIFLWSYPAEPPDAKASPSQKLYSFRATRLAVSEKAAVPLSAATTR